MRDKIVGIETIAERKFLKMVGIYWQDREGNLREWEAIRRTTGAEIVSVIPVTDNGEVILIEQFRPPVGKMVIEFPAGLCDQDEIFEEAAVRETREEIGYQAGKIRKLFAGPVSAGLSHEFLTVFLATNLKFVGKEDGQEEREITVYEISLKEVDEWLDSKEKRGVLVDVKIKAYISYVKNILAPQHSISIALKNI